MRSIPDQNQVILLRDFHEGIVIAWLPTHVDSNDGLGAFCKEAAYTVHINQHCRGIALRELDDSTLVQHDVRARCKCHGWHDHLIPGADASCKYSRMQSCGAVAYTHTVLCSDLLTHFLFEFLHLGSGGQVCGLECLNDDRNVVIVNS